MQPVGIIAPGTAVTEFSLEAKIIAFALTITNVAGVSAAMSSSFTVSRTIALRCVPCPGSSNFCAEADAFFTYPVNVECSGAEHPAEQDCFNAPVKFSFPSRGLVPRVTTDIKAMQ